MIKRAFSLIELSIVLLIIGIIIAGVTSSSRLISEFRLVSARTLTESSPITSIKNLLLWLEATSENSFLDSEMEDTAKISTWRDINQTSSIKNNASQSTSGYKPIYVANCINSLPCVRFDGSDDYMDFDGAGLVGTNYTVIVVEQRRSNADGNLFIGGHGEGTDLNLHAGYRTNTSIAFAQYSNDYSITVSGYSSPTPTIHVLTFNSAAADAKTYHINGVKQTMVDDGGAVKANGLTSYEGAMIGSLHLAGLVTFFNGDIAEVVMFSKALRNEERRAIESYLSKKWKISIS